MKSRIHFTRPQYDMKQILLEFAELRPFGGASLIVADPPWRHEDWSAEGNKKKTAGHQYETQPIDWIEQLPVGAIAAKDCLLWLWTTAPLIPAALGVVEAWGFEFKTEGAWVKRTVTGKLGIATGRRLRSSHEPFILATRGRPPVSQAVRSIIATDDESHDPIESLGITIEAIRREHSRKPDDAFEAARLCVDGPAVELFSRQRRAGWGVWGNEVSKFDEAAE